MKNPFVSLADLWISRHATPSADAQRDVAGLRPAVVVTGGSRGIGRAMAHRFASAGRGVAVVARGRPALDEAADAIRRTGGTAVAIALDVTQPEAAQQLGDALREAGLYTDILVNNAGVGLSGPFERHTIDDLDGLIALNVAAVTRLMRDALPGMLARGQGGILNVASLGGLVPGPHQAAYYASKAYVLSLTEAVAHEVRGRGVRVAALAPGPVNTRFHRAMRADNAVYRRFVPALSPEAVAASAYRQFAIGRRIIVPGMLPAAASLALRVLPHAVTVPIVGVLLSDGPRR